MILLRVLGSLELIGPDGEPILSVLSQPKRTALLVYLAVTRPRGFHRRDKILAIFWPELDSERARAALSTSLSFLRRSLGEDVILTRGAEEVGVDLDLLFTDVLAFEEALEAQDPEPALDQYRGHLLEGFFLSGAPGFVYWLDEERERLRERAADAAWDLAHRQILAMELAPAERTAQKALRWVPTDESRVRGFVVALARAGDRAAAVRFYEKFAQVLEEELELEPSAETVEVVERMREGRGEGRAEEEEGEGGANVRPLPGVDTTSIPAEPVSVPDHRQPDDPIRGTNRWRGRTLRSFLGLAVLGLAVVLSSWPWGASEASEERVVVLPFENLTGDPSLDPVGDWAADFISRGLMEAPGIPEVTLKDPVLSAPAPTRDSAAARELWRSWPRRTRATLAVRGSYYLCAPGDSIEFHLEVVGPDGRIRGVVPVVRGATGDPSEGLGRLQVQAVRTVAEILVPGHELAWTAGGRSPPKLEAYKATNEGWMTFASVGYEASIPFFEHALELDSLYFFPLLMLKSAYGNLRRYAEVDSICAIVEKRIALADSRERLSAEYHCRNLRTPNRTLVEITRDMAKRTPVGEYLLGGMLLGANRPGEAAEVLSRYDTTLGGVSREWEDTNAYYWAMALHLIGEYPRELELVRDVRQRFPESRPLIYQEISALIALERGDEARRMIEDNFALWPAGRSPVTLFEQPGQEFDAHGHPEEARNLWDRSLAWLEGRPAEERESGSNRQARSRLLLYLDRLGEAELLLVPLASETPDDVTNLGLLGILKAKQGDRQASEEISEALAAWASLPPYGQTQVWRARIAAQLGETDEAVAFLKRAAEEEWWMGDNLHRDVFLKPLRGHKAFEEFVRPKG